MSAGQRNSQAARPRVLAVASHPIQYQVPWFRALTQSARFDFSVLFIQLPDAKQQGHGFGVAFEWDIPLLDGYRWTQASHVNGPGGFDGFFAARLGSPLKLLRDSKADVVLLTGWHIWPLIQLLVAARWLGIPVIMRGESNALRPRGFLARTWHRLLLGRCAAMLPIGKASHAFYAGYGIEEQQLFDAPYFVDNARFASAAAQWAPQQAALREAWNIPADAACFLYAGKLEPKKRILDLLAALAAMKTTTKPVHLLVVGSGELKDEALAFVAAHDLPVTFAGFLNQSEIGKAYACADCLVLPSDFGETWGLVVNEAMASGLPAIVSDRVGCAPDLITDGATGFVFPFGDTAALAAHMTRTAAEPQHLPAMGAQARERVLRNYGVQNAVDATIRAVDHVLKR
ncbi:MAG: glycosyltransferase family 4 protein [Ramlibacter sp.]|nr:glycosyltransferase family 4 protein [Ramlibacter sp.]